MDTYASIVKCDVLGFEVFVVFLFCWLAADPAARHMASDSSVSRGSVVVLVAALAALVTVETVQMVQTDAGV